MKENIRSLVRGIYHRIPLTHTKKQKLKDTVYTSLRPLIQHTEMYLVWAQTKSIPVHIAHDTMLSKSKYFDAKWYRSQYPEVKFWQNPIRHYLNVGWKKGYNPSLNFDGNAYLETYPDVKKTGMNPLVHYIKYGKKENRFVSAVGLQIFLENHDFKQKDCDVLILSHFPASSGCYIWRVDYLQEILKANGIKTTVAFAQDFGENDFWDYVYSAKIIIYQRPVFEDAVIPPLLRFLEEYEKFFIIDMDDLYNPGYCKHQGGYLSRVIPNYTNLTNHHILVNLLLNYAGCLSVSTAFLKQTYGDLFPGKAIVVRKNVIPQFFLNRTVDRKTDGEFTLLSSSGSDSHNYDLSLVLPEIISFLSKYENTNLVLLGKVNCSQLLVNLFGGRVRLYPFCNIGEMFEVYTRADLALAPLDRNPFNDAKSNIKFIEAGQCGVPVLATDCAEFKDVIQDGKNGFLTDNENFAGKLEEIFALHQAGNLAQVGENAKQYILNNMTCEADTDNELVQMIKTVLER